MQYKTVTNKVYSIVSSAHLNSGSWLDILNASVSYMLSEAMLYAIYKDSSRIKLIVLFDCNKGINIEAFIGK